MATKQQIMDDFTTAFKAKNEIKKRTLGSIKAEVLVYEKSGKSGEVDEAVMNDILKSMAKKRRESLEAYESAGREDLAQTEREELAVIESYLPEQMSEAQVREIAQRVIAENGFTKADFGRAMGAVMKETSGQADGGAVKRAVEEIMGNK